MHEWLVQGGYDTLHDSVPHIAGVIKDEVSSIDVEGRTACRLWKALHSIWKPKTDNVCRM